jgi:hypothetical protein
MNRTLWRLGLSFFAGALLAAGGALLLTRAFAQAKPAPPKPPEPQPVANIVQVPPPNAANPFQIRDYGKSVIEVPTEQILAGNTTPAPTPAADKFVNPKVQPGKVRWHKDFAAACRAAQKSGKPVLLFQMMGKLDDRFC